MLLIDSKYHITYPNLLVFVCYGLLVETWYIYPFLQSLRGPRGGMIFFRKDPILGVDLESAINNAVFPGLQVSCYFMS